MDSTELVSAAYLGDFKSRQLNDAGEAEEPMKKLRPMRWQSFRPVFRNTTIGVSAALLLAGNAFAQAAGNSPWENAVNVLQTAFTGPIAKGLALVAIVVGGLTFAFGEGGGKKTFAGIVFGLGMAVLAVNFLTWLFGV
jgi:type IV secretory pathway VirB2 component (pilin)